MFLDWPQTESAIASLGRVSRLATRVVSYNPAVAEWAERTWGLERVEVLPPGVPEAPEVDRAAVRQAHGLDPERFVALFVGRDVPKKGLDVLVAAAEPAYDLVAVTDRDPARAPAGVQFLPFMPPARLRELMAAADAFVLPSEGEGFPLALQEALVTGLPCVVVPGPGYERYLREGEAVFVRREREALRGAMRLLAADEERRAEAARHARAAGTREFGVTGFVAAYERVYAELGAGSKTASPTPLAP